MVSVFILITGDAWDSMMYDAVDAVGYGAIAYFVIVICFGTYIVINLFMAVLISHLHAENAEKKFAMEDCITYAKELRMQKHGNGNNLTKTECLMRLVSKLQRMEQLTKYHQGQREGKHSRDKLKLEGASFGLFAPTNWFRQQVHAIVTHRAFDICVDLLILVNCGFLSADQPKTNEQSHTLFFIADLIFTSIFAAEMLLKNIALGCFRYVIVCFLRLVFCVLSIRICGYFLAKKKTIFLTQKKKKKKKAQDFCAKRKWKTITDDEKIAYWTWKSHEVVTRISPPLEDKLIVPSPALAIEVIESNDEYEVVHAVAMEQDYRIVFKNSEKMV
ncbi:voltage-gated ion channel superfamily [Reticulomyxa filosa]|uniref:Voltage-gated ion channel superfamily n=1 Tax=Reticulomyxa filosa TaxID=46433 RepID=X6MWZ7_RETFI|nr:voltage-gated ion channel superfamily [Reticulomyxa filosa]|eukprot:ETO18528.1 voltage-gated ion channel superfamily [Reticulomyxa filosa]